MSSRRTKHNRTTNNSRKYIKQVRFLKDVKICNMASINNVKHMTTEYIKHHIVLCDGGDTIDDAIQTDVIGSDIQVLHIRNGDLWVADTGNATLGLHFNSPGDKVPIFV